MEERGRAPLGGRRGVTPLIKWLALVAAMLTRAMGADDILGMGANESHAYRIHEEELSPALESNRQPLGPDPLAWPQWTKDELSAFDAGWPENLGNGLWSPERYPLQPVPAHLRELKNPNRSPPGALNWKGLASYGQASTWLADPQALLAEDQRAVHEGELVRHAASAIHPVRVWVLDDDQWLPPIIDDATWHRLAFGADRPGLLAVASVNAPRDVRLIVPPAVAARTAALKGQMIDFIMAAGDAPTQWHQLIAGVQLAAAGLPPLEPAPDVLRMPPAPAHESANQRQAGDASGRFSIAVMLAAGLLMTLALGVLAARRRRAHRARPSNLPMVWIDVEHPSRLGGPYSGGSGVVIKW